MCCFQQRASTGIIHDDVEIHLESGVGRARIRAVLSELGHMHRALMQLYAEDGDRPAAIKQYFEMVKLLEEGLGVDPTPETTALFSQIRAGNVGARVPERGELIIRGYELRELVNEGNYAAVYRAYHPMTGRNVAVKVINSQFANQPDFIRRFEFEAQLVARLEHPYEVLLTLQGHAPGQSGETFYNGITGAAFSPDGALIATASDDLTAKIWDALTGRELFSLEGYVSASASNPPFEGVVQAVFHPSGALVATAGADGTVKMWDANTGQELITLTVQPQGLLDVAISPDGKYLATAGWNGAVHLFVLSTDELISLAQSRVTRSLTEEECQRYLHLEACPVAR